MTNTLKGQMVADMRDTRDSDAYLVVPCIDHSQSGGVAGHGNTNFEGKHTSLHRVIYCRSRQVSLASIKGLVVRHDCDRGRCIEPLHLRIGTQRENVNDMVVRGRARGRVGRGDENGNSKLSAAQVLEIRALHAAGVVSNRAIARDYGVTPTLIGYIVRRLNWTHI